MGSGRGKPWLLWTALMVPAAATLAGIGTYAGVLGPEDPPKPSRADLVGSYEDGQGGEVTLRADGTAEVRGIEYAAEEEPGFAVLKRCEDGAVHWAFTETRPRWHDQVSLRTTCESPTPWLWDAGGSPAAPELIHWTFTPGHPDSRRVLTRR
ncbi:hypothetical protein [Streptomyces filamentosus]|uniref:hypothetical protein n=1 Tax=Streptomyces filamentosus TaxID=67294 RepID=UPI0037D70A44